MGEAQREKRREAIKGRRKDSEADSETQNGCWSEHYHIFQHGGPGCKERGPHSVVGLDDGQPVVLVDCDQNFPAIMFSLDKKACIEVLRAEDATIKELAVMLGDLLDRDYVPRGSVCYPC